MSEEHTRRVQRLMNINMKLEVPPEFVSRLANDSILLDNRITGKSDKEVIDIMISKEEQKRSKSVGLMYHILTSGENPQLYQRMVRYINGGGVEYWHTVLRSMEMILSECWSFIHLACKEQLLRLIREAVRQNVKQVENVLMNAYRAAIGSCDLISKQWLFVKLTAIIRENEGWFKSQKACAALVANILTCTTYVIVSSPAPMTTQDTFRESMIDLVYWVIKNRKSDCLALGRDFILILIRLGKLPKIEEIWKDLATNPLTYGVESIVEYMGKSNVLQHLRVSIELDRKLQFMVHNGGKNLLIYFAWLSDKFFRGTDGPALRAECVRHILYMSLDPTEVQPIVLENRIQLLHLLITTAPSGVEQQWLKLCLFADWFGCDERNLTNFNYVEVPLAVVRYALFLDPPTPHPNAIVQSSHSSYFANALLEYVCKSVDVIFPVYWYSIQLNVCNAITHCQDRNQNISQILEHSKIDRKVADEILEIWPEVNYYKLTFKDRRSDVIHDYYCPKTLTMEQVWREHLSKVLELKGFNPAGLELEDGNFPMDKILMDCWALTHAADDHKKVLNLRRKGPVNVLELVEAEGMYYVEFRDRIGQMFVVFYSTESILQNVWLQQRDWFIWNGKSQDNYGIDQLGPTVLYRLDEIWNPDDHKVVEVYTKKVLAAMKKKQEQNFMMMCSNRSDSDDDEDYKKCKDVGEKEIRDLDCERQAKGKHEASQRNSEYPLNKKTFKVAAELFIENRQRLVESLKPKVPANSVILLKGGVETNRYNTDAADLPFRQESYFFWAFGVNESEFYGIIDVTTGKTTLFAPPLDQNYAIWDGKVNFKEKYAVDEVIFNDEPEKIAVKLKALAAKQVYLLRAEKFAGSQEFQLNTKLLYKEMAELRVIKSEKEIDVMRYASKIASEAHRTVMKHMKPRLYEYQLESLFRHISYLHGGRRHPAYTCIAASGSVLKYGHTHSPSYELKEGDMCLFDMGPEYNCYASDITTSFPSNGKFTEKQKIVYNAVLDANLAVLKAAKPGVSWVDMHLLSEKVILEHLKKAGLVVGDVDKAVEARVGAVFMPHGLGHLIGLDVHDCGGYMGDAMPRSKLPGLKSLRTTRTLKERMAITIEPGCYFIDFLLDEALADPVRNVFLVKAEVDKYRGSGGVRIQDDVIIRASGNENLSDLPRTVDEIENFMATGGEWTEK